MEKYDYRKAVFEDVMAYVKEMHTEYFDTREELEERLNDDLWTVDSVTGNASGSYTFNAWKAEEYLCHNWDLLAEAASEFGGSAGEWFEHGAEYCDVSIRCYLLGEAIGRVLDELDL